MTRKLSVQESVALALSVMSAVAVSLPAPARAAAPEVPAVPAGLEAPVGNVPFLEGHAVGTQNYTCLPTATGGFAYTLFTPEATLFDDHGKQLITHFFAPNAIENGTIRATWQHSKDSSEVFAKLVKPSTDPAFVAPGAIPWLLLAMAGVQPGPTGGATLTTTTFVQRINTEGGVAPATGCASAADVGRTAFVPYTADYYFYRDVNVVDE
jgi:uncharacterized protein DUF3455